MQTKTTLQVNESYINQTKGYCFGESGWINSWTDNIGELFKSCQKEYGRCTSKIYVDLPDGTADPIGWVFEKTMVYEDARNTDETYVREVWVSYRRVKAT